MFGSITAQLGALDVQMVSVMPAKLGKNTFTVPEPASIN
jgi:hypothetical protein